MKKQLRLIGILSLGALLSACGTPAGTSSALSNAEQSASSAAASVSSEAASSIISAASSSIDYSFGTYQNGTFPRRNNGSDYRTEIADPSTPQKSEKDGYYYLYSTDRRQLRSEDLCTWELVSENFINFPTWTHGGTGYLWAPDVVHIGDNWILYYAIHDTTPSSGTYYDSIGYAIAADAAGPWQDMGKLVEGPEINNASCIDPAVFVQPDGSVYMSLGSFSGIDLIRLSDDGMSLYGGVSQQLNDKKRITYGACEGSYLTFRNGYYYLWLSLGSCCSGKDSTYRVMVARSKSIGGPYLDNQGTNITTMGCNDMKSLCLWAGMASDRQVYGPGHNSVFKDDAGDEWIIYHGYFAADNYQTRHLMIDKILYDESGFPYVDTKKPSYMEELDGPRFI